MDKQYAEYLLKKTKENYDKISEQFSVTRYSVWPEVRLLGDYFKDGDRVLDLGCGNGRFIELLGDKKIEYVGIDNSKELIEIAKKKYPGVDFRVADALFLPFPDNYFDKILSIAVLHHIPSEEFRLQFMKEAGRVLKPGGLLVLTVWDLWKRKKQFKLIIKFALLKISGKTRFDFKDIFLPWQKTVDRYVHCFTKGELVDLARRAGFKIKKSGISRRGETQNANIYLIAEK